MSTHTALPRSLGYIRTSTDQQAPDRQILGLKALCDVLYIEDGVSARAERRPEYERMRRSLKSGDTVIVWALDRAYRSTIDALREMKAFRRRGIRFQIATMALNPDTPDGMLIYTILAALGEWESNIIRVRTNEGLDVARGNGVRLGRPPKLSKVQLEQALKELGSRQIKDIAAGLGVAPWTLTRAIRRLGREGKGKTS